MITNPRLSKTNRKTLRNNLTPAERKLWYFLRNKQLGIKFRRQFGVGKYIVDFYAPSIKLVIEVDGDTHYTEETVEADKRRTQYLNDQGLTVLRFTNEAVFNNIEFVIGKIQTSVDTLTTPSNSP